MPPADQCTFFLGIAKRLGYFRLVQVLREKGFVFQIYPSDHSPAHVHVFKGGREVILNLGSDPTALSVRENRRMPQPRVRHALEIAEARWLELREKWDEIYAENECRRI